MAHPTSSPRPTAPQDRGHPAPAGSPPAPPGTYRNPILDEDWPDPDVIRVGGEYLMIASSFNRAPGLPVLRSTDRSEEHTSELQSRGPLVCRLLLEKKKMN